MQQVLSNQTFTGNGGLGESGGFAAVKSYLVNLNGGTASLQIQTPSGWATIQSFQQNTLDQFKTQVFEQFRFVLAGGAEAFLI